MGSADVLVTKLDRLGRNAMGVRVSVEQLASTGARVHCLALGGVDLTSPAGKMTMPLLNAVAEFDRDLLIERTNSGVTRAKAEGKHMGRKHSLSVKQRNEIQQRLAGGTSVRVLANEYDTTRETIMRVRTQRKSYLNEHLTFQNLSVGR